MTTAAKGLERLLDLKLVLVSLVLAVAVAIPSMGGTFADFTASTSNPGLVFQTATLSITTDHPASGFVEVANLMPGDTVTRTVTVINTGSAPFTYAVSATKQGGGPGSALWSNKVKGLQVTLSNSTGTLYEGPISELQSIKTGVEVASGNTEVLTFVFSLPNAAGNAFQGLSAPIVLDYHATQVAGTAR